jgi:hypothetical protein
MASTELALVLEYLPEKDCEPCVGDGDCVSCHKGLPKGEFVAVRKPDSLIKKVEGIQPSDFGNGRWLHSHKAGRV